jgi:hypothetical protein
MLRMPNDSLADSLWWPLLFQPYLNSVFLYIIPGINSSAKGLREP